MIGNTTACTSRYEDWIDPRARDNQSASLQKCLGLSPTPLLEGEDPIQETHPILDTIANSKEVEKALRGTEFEYMLEDAALDTRPRIHDAGGIEYGFLDEAARDAVFDKLKASERFYTEGFSDFSDLPIAFRRLKSHVKWPEV